MWRARSRDEGSDGLQIPFSAFAEDCTVSGELAIKTDRLSDFLASTVEFEVASPEAVREAAAELGASGHEQLHPPREEPWGQSIARWLSRDGAILGISHVPSMH